MSLLLDTNIVIWIAEGNPRLNDAVIELLDDPKQDVFVSAISSCEVAIKWAQGKIELPGSPQEFLTQLMKLSGFSQLALTIEQAAGLATLPFHHRDPWDRLLISQAKSMGLRIVTSDRIFTKYDVDVMTV